LKRAHFQFFGTELHAAMNRAVLDACGWSDIATAGDLLLDYEDRRGRLGRKKKPCRSTPATFSAVASDGTSSRLEMRRRVTPARAIFRAG